jgi:hypothetical protein
MIAEWFGEVVIAFVAWLASIWGDFEIPQWAYDSRGTMIDLLASYSGLGVWVDWQALGICMAAVGATYALGLVVRLIRVLVAHIPQFGGGGG